MVKPARENTNPDFEKWINDLPLWMTKMRLRTRDYLRTHERKGLYAIKGKIKEQYTQKATICCQKKGKLTPISEEGSDNGTNEEKKRLTIEIPFRGNSPPLRFFELPPTPVTCDSMHTTVAFTPSRERKTPF